MAEQPPRSTHKFGGASVKDAAAIRMVGQLLSDHLREEEQAVVVVSAMGKTTNALEAVWRSSGSEQEERWAEISQAHFDVASELGLDVTNRLQSVFEASWQEAQSAQEEGLTEASYDAFVSAGELASTTLVAAWCVAQGLDTVWWTCARRCTPLDRTGTRGWTKPRCGRTERRFARPAFHHVWWSPKGSLDGTPAAGRRPSDGKGRTTARHSLPWRWGPSR